MKPCSTDVLERSTILQKSMPVHPATQPLIQASAHSADGAIPHDLYDIEEPSFFFLPKGLQGKMRLCLLIQNWTRFILPP